MSNKVLFFKNISELKEENKQTPAFSLATFYLASAMSKLDDFQIILSDYFLADNEEIFAEKNEQLKIFLKDNQNINFICLTLVEGYFEKFQQLLSLIRQHSKAFIVVGGLMPTLSAEQVFYNLPEIDILVRGEGEDVLPVVLTLLKDSKYNSNIGTDILKELKAVDGLIFRNNGQVYKGNLGKINFNKDFKLQSLNFDLFESNDFIDGLKLYSSRGCLNYCNFCTSFLHHNYYAFSFEDLLATLDNYANKLVSWFGDLKNVPKNYFRISFYDDDFLVDRKRAMNFFDFIRSHPYFYIGFFQTGIKSFYLYDDRQATDELDFNLLNSLSQDIFKREKIAADDHFIYIGTENFSDKELAYLNKGYTFKKIAQVAEELSKRNIYQAHHFIFSNIYTTFDDIFENLTKIFILHLNHRPYFQILTPVIENLVSYFNTPSFKLIEQKNDLGQLKIKKIIGQDDNKYILVDYDLPKDEMVSSLAKIINKINEHGFENIPVLFEKILLHILLEKERLFNETNNTKDLNSYEAIIDKYRFYRNIILQKEKELFNTNTAAQELFQSNDRLVIVVTHLCQLDCAYCFIKKYNGTISEKDLYKAIDLLFTSEKKDIQLQFFGGEPLLKFDLLKKAIFYSQLLNKKFKKNLSYLLTTNGLLLNKEIISFLRKYKVEIELSIDGDYETISALNNKKLDKKSFFSLIKNINLLNVNKMKYYVIMVVSPDNVGKIVKNFDYLKENKAVKIQINYAVGIYWPEDKFSLYLENFKYLHDKYKKIMHLNREPILFNSELLIDSTGEIIFVNAFFLKTGDSEKYNNYALGTLADNKKISYYSTNRFLDYEFLTRRLSDQERKLFFNNAQAGIRVYNMINSDHWLNN